MESDTIRVMTNDNVVVPSYLLQMQSLPPTVSFLSTGDLHGHLEDLLIIFYKVLGKQSVCVSLVVTS